MAAPEVHLRDRCVHVGAEGACHDRVSGGRYRDRTGRVRSLAAEGADQAHLAGGAGNLQHEGVGQSRGPGGTQRARELAHRPEIAGLRIQRDGAAGRLPIPRQARGPDLLAVAGGQPHREALLPRLPDHEDAAVRRDRLCQWPHGSDSPDPAHASGSVGAQHEGASAFQQGGSGAQLRARRRTRQRDSTGLVRREGAGHRPPHQRQDVAGRERARRRRARG